MDGMTYWFRYAAVARAVPEAPKLAVNVLDDWGLAHMRDSVRLIVSELVTNSVRATGTTKPEVSYRV